MMSSGKTSGGKTGKADQRVARQARLAAALRQNLKRRKQQARERAVADKPAPGAASPQGSEAAAGTTGAAPDFRRNRHEE